MIELVPDGSLTGAEATAADPDADGKLTPAVCVEAPPRLCVGTPTLVRVAVPIPEVVGVISPEGPKTMAPLETGLPGTEPVMEASPVASDVVPSPVGFVVGRMMTGGTAPDPAAPELTAVPAVFVTTVPSPRVTAVEKTGSVTGTTGMAAPVDAAVCGAVVVASSPALEGRVTAVDNGGRVIAFEMGTSVVRVTWSLEMVTGTESGSVAGGTVVVGGMTTGTSVTKVVCSFEITKGADVESSVMPDGSTVGTVTPTSAVKVVWSLETVTGMEIGSVAGGTTVVEGTSTGTLVTNVI